MFRKKKGNQGGFVEEWNAREKDGKKEEIAG